MGQYRSFTRDKANQPKKMMIKRQTAAAAIQSQTRKSEYRPEIDGLRALAVTAVIINHFNKELLPSGYLGVDIFFVISGYVITSSLNERPSKDFNDFLSGFYERRIKRLVPALSVFVLIASVAISLVSPAPESSLKTGAASLFGLSNIYLLKEATDYFAQSTELNIFTHTWSLGVEEQFYILFPFIIWFSGFGRQKKQGVRNLFVTIGALSTASLAGFVYMYSRDQTATYFLMPLRFWEMAAGCLVFIGFKKRAWLEDMLEKLPPLVLISLIIGAMYLPIGVGCIATISVVALTSILIVSLKRNTAAYEIFTSRIMVYIGMISYSLYLWHWGVLAISRWTIGIHLWTVPFQAGIILGLSAASYRWIETPLRKGNWPCRRWKTLLLGGSVLASLSGGVLVLSNMPGGRLYIGDYSAATQDDYSEYIPPTREKCEPKAYSANSCRIRARGGGSQTLLLIGDSHAGHLIPLLGRMHAKEGIGVSVSILGNYPYLLQSNNEGMTLDASREIQNTRDISFNTLIQGMRDGDIVLLSSRWEHYLYEDFFNLEHKNRRRKLYSDNGAPISTQEALHLLERKLGRIAKDLEARKIRLVIVAPLPVFRGTESPSPSWACTKEWFRPFISKDCSKKYAQSRQSIGERIQVISDGFEDLRRENNNTYVYDTFNMLCPSLVTCTTMLKGMQIFRDDDHLSKRGAEYLADDFIRFLKNNDLIRQGQVGSIQ